jgi:hypothetical protein
VQPHGERGADCPDDHDRRAQHEADVALESQQYAEQGGLFRWFHGADQLGHRRGQPEVVENVEKIGGKQDQDENGDLLLRKGVGKDLADHEHGRRRAEHGPGG